MDEKNNEIVVKVANVVPSERWYSGSGIYRDVTMIVTEQVHVDYRGTMVNFPNLAATNGADGTTDVAVTVRNESSADASVTVVSTIKDGETTEDGLFTLNNVACLGCCSLAPVMMVKSADEDETYGNLTKDSVVQVLEEIRARA